jgi:exopolyphosphatase/guanosine-5'-triphosphate,3'-diphosphate pyrophosphatase
VVIDARRPLLAYAAVVLEHIVRKAEPKDVVFSALGVRGCCIRCSMLRSARRTHCWRCARSQSPAIALAPTWRRIDQMDRCVHGLPGLDETAEKRLRHAYLLADTG